MESVNNKRDKVLDIMFATGGNRGVIRESCHVESYDLVDQILRNLSDSSGNAVFYLKWID
ncbi:hypothetical protein GCM10027180_28740 [Microbulbifer echini]